MTPEQISAQFNAQLLGASNHFSQVTTASMGRSNLYSEGVHNQQLHNLVISPSSAEELIYQMSNNATAMRMSQPPISPPVAA